MFHRLSLFAFNNTFLPGERSVPFFMDYSTDVFCIVKQNFINVLPCFHTRMEVYV